MRLTCNHRLVLMFLSILFIARGLQAKVYQLPLNGDTVVGNITQAVVKPNDNLYKIARKYDVGYDELILANSLIDPDKIIVGQKINIPTAYILPRATTIPELIINLAEKRLYYYINADFVFTAPIAIGRQGWETPTATAFVDRKVEAPVWKVPEQIRIHNAKLGKKTPRLIPAGPNNPLGEYAITLTLPNYVIHGTNDPTTIGKRISAGCIRMYPEDIAYLFNEIPTGARVRITSKPYKVGYKDKHSFIEAHGDTLSQEALDELFAKHPSLIQYQANIDTIITQGRGIPQKIT